ncbi:MAG: hypothetical protein QW279_12085, partial [Candidatus Jordarchaeaceae archaeon]
KSTHKNAPKVKPSTRLIQGIIERRRTHKHQQALQNVHLPKMAYIIKTCKYRKGLHLNGSKTPYGEARRLRYFSLICKELLKSQPINVDLFIDKLLLAVTKINPKLTDYMRTTGIMKTRAVTRNYLRFASWLNFLRIESYFVMPSAYTVFLANLKSRDDFVLDEEEKVGFFLALIKIKEVQEVLQNLQTRNSIKKILESSKLSEHFVESFFEWFVDLNILRPSSRQFGTFNLTNLGYHTVEAAKSAQILKIIKSYLTHLLGFEIECETHLRDDDIGDLLDSAIKKLGSYTRSEIDQCLHSALPIVLEMQLRLIFCYHTFIETEKLIKRLENISPCHNIIFSWDSLANAGFIKILR